MWEGVNPFEREAREVVGQHLGLRLSEHLPLAGVGALGLLGGEDALRAFLDRPHDRQEWLYLLRGRVVEVVDGRGRLDPAGIALSPLLRAGDHRARAWVRSMAGLARGVGGRVALREADTGLRAVRPGWLGGLGTERWCGRSLVVHLDALDRLDDPTGEDPWTLDAPCFWVVWPRPDAPGVVFRRRDAAIQHATARLPPGRYAVTVWRVASRVRGGRRRLADRREVSSVSLGHRSLGPEAFAALVQTPEGGLVVVGGPDAPWTDPSQPRAWAEAAGVQALIAVRDAVVDKF